MQNLFIYVCYYWKEEFSIENNLDNIYTNIDKDKCCGIIKYCFNIPYKEGPTGPTGPTGPAGPSFNAAAMVHDESNLLVASNNPLKLGITNISNGITYDKETGEFTIPEDGQYLIHWWVNVKNKKNSEFTCEKNTLGIELHQCYPEDILIAHSSTHNKLNFCETGTISGNAIFNGLANHKYRFINTSDVDFELVPNDKYSGSFTITKIN